MTSDTLRHAEQQMLMARPWDAAEPESLWEITGEYPGEKHAFLDCLAYVLPADVTGDDGPVFVFVGALALAGSKPVFPAWITHARPLLIVHRDEPYVAYYQEDQEWIDTAEASRG
jgi:hypothetical protein